MLDIYSRSPINKTAALVTSQGGCATDGTLSSEQIRENLVSKLKAIEVEILACKKGSKKRKELGKKKTALQEQVSEIRPKMKCKGVKDHILDILREELTDFEFKRILKKASLRASNLET